MCKLFFKKIFLIHCTFFLFQKINAQQLSREIELGNQLNFCNEPAIAINPDNTTFEIIASNKKHIFFSKKNGAKFHHKKAKSTMGVYGDPVLLYNKKGTCFYVHLAQDKTKSYGDSFDQIVVQKSLNNGKKWHDGVGVGKNGKMHDKAWISIDENAKSKYNGNIYLSWTQFDKYESKEPEDSSRILFAFSNDECLTFSKPVVVSDMGGDCLDGDSTVEGATTCTGTDGGIYIAWAAYEKIFLDKSTDGGKTFGRDKVIMECPKGWNLDVPGFFRTNGLPFINSNARGDLFLCTAYEENGFNKVFVSESNDNGNTWSTPKSLANRDSTHYFMPHAYLDKSTGNLYVIYYRKNKQNVDVFLSYKSDKSNEFKHIRLNKYTFLSPGKARFMGDYINVCAVDKIISCVWTEPKGISTVLKTRRLILD